ncbi:polysaccharide deacetylase family protein [Bradyrhizobium sp. CCGUVB1N3]|uniref:polysaccharide deacetylase family protein n=1 Tax=Bradyrhizobium sp. CCGUVB1N3 TaxID=2949629 RepID=UPI0020B2BDE5|nr:polysaccharide deacetylase family protein [Bradyrhizobium sp. CCGUVB1N3]MCP3470547.1 polysaccharide deacetylase family protein [Bradyrhizobium sp. CCGUVB1N3]
MIGRRVSCRTRSWIVCLGFLTAGPAAALAADCPGHPDALGTSRTIVVDPREHPRIGTMQYRETLPLRDHEVVLTFDDGPLPKYSNQVLQILANECIKATFFTIGKQAQANPEGVRKLVAAGHTVGTHSYSHPLTFEKMPIEKAQAEIDGGIQWTSAAMTDPSALAPFFRIPGLLRAQGVENLLASRGIQLWSADFPADDWRHVSPERVYQLAIQRLEAKGKGILLLHDIQPRTVAALPKILRELKARGYRIVNVVPATADRPATPTELVEWLLHPPSENVAAVRWPRIPSFVFTRSETLRAPLLSDLNAELPRQVASSHWGVAKAGAESLAVPSRDLFEIKEGSLEVLMATAASRHVATRLARATTADAVSSGNAKGRGQAAAVAAHGGKHGQTTHATAKRTARNANASAARPTKLASLKKRQQ